MFRVGVDATPCVSCEQTEKVTSLSPASFGRTLPSTLTPLLIENKHLSYSVPAAAPSQAFRRAAEIMMVLSCASRGLSHLPHPQCVARLMNGKYTSLSFSVSHPGSVCPSNPPLMPKNGIKHTRECSYRKIINH